jgi:hypothetical protein
MFGKSFSKVNFYHTAEEHALLTKHGKYHDKAYAFYPAKV